MNLPESLRSLFYGPERFRDRGLYIRPKSGKEAPFETVLKYSTQKRVLAAELAGRLNNIENGDEISILDIGSSKGTQIAMLAGRLMIQGFEKRINFTLLEPDKSSVHSLENFAEAIYDQSETRFASKVVQQGWEEFSPEMYHAIICSHVIYHFDPKNYHAVFEKMIHALRPNGHLFISARERKGNDVFHFIQQYKTLATDEKFNEITIDHILPTLDDIMRTNPTLTMERQELQSNVLFPFKTEPEAAETLVAFFLQRASWGELPSQIRESILQDYGGKDTVLAQSDRFIDITEG